MNSIKFVPFAEIFKMYNIKIPVSMVNLEELLKYVPSLFPVSRLARQTPSRAVESVEKLN